MKLKSNIAISDSGFVFNPTNGESFSLNPIGVEIINKIKDNDSFDDIKEVILKKYHIDESTFEKDYADFINFLTHYNLIENNEEA